MSRFVSVDALACEIDAHSNAAIPPMDRFMTLTNLREAIDAESARLFRLITEAIDEMTKHAPAPFTDADLERLVRAAATEADGSVVITRK
jgi:hypothetical protein